MSNVYKAKLLIVDIHGGALIIVFIRAEGYAPRCYSLSQYSCHKLCCAWSMTSNFTYLLLSSLLLQILVIKGQGKPVLQQSLS